MAHQSTVKFFNDEKGFGFINHVDGESLFMHRNEVVEGMPGDGDTVMYDTGVDDRSGKPKAQNIVVVGGGTGKGRPLGGGKGPGGGKGGKGSGNIAVLKKGLQYAGVLPGGKWTNDENALFIGGLPTDTTDGDLYEIFAPFGAIPTRGVRAMTNPDGTCKGIGFINFLENASAQNAIATLNGTMMPDGTALKVSIKAVSKGPGKGEGKGEGK
mmetsp:Transcript_17101/g.43012  ORF Transcript_17101/g.43012 Transcript_17101/m.43012 type:complete len:212 (-) Transcript_17101:121-756(-)